MVRSAAQLHVSNHGPERRAIARFACGGLELHLACRSKACRKAQRCRDERGRCLGRASVPEPALAWVSSLLIRSRAPWLPLIGDESGSRRQAYDCWIAGLEAGARGAR